MYFSIQRYAMSLSTVEDAITGVTLKEKLDKSKLLVPLLKELLRSILQSPFLLFFWKEFKET